MVEMMIIGVMKAGEGRKSAGHRSWGSEVVCIQDSNMTNCREYPGQNRMWCGSRESGREIEEGALPVVYADAVLTGVILLVIVK